ncbi:MAG: hypothetical protein K0S42_3060, partial [Microvirga sp.]|nr:hypothetical protein [Microvirga sp.]
SPSLRQSRQSGHSFPGACRRPEWRRTRAFAVIHPNHGDALRSPFWAISCLFSAHFLQRNRTTPVLVRMLEAQKINRLGSNGSGAGLKGARSGGVCRDRTIWFRYNKLGQTAHDHTGGDSCDSGGLRGALRCERRFNRLSLEIALEFGLGPGNRVLDRLAGLGHAGD